MSLSRRSQRALATLWWHDIDEVEYSEANWVIRQWNAKQIHPENDVKNKAMLTTQSNIQADRMAAKGKCPGGRLLLETLIIKLHESCSERKLENNYSRMLVNVINQKTLNGWRQICRGHWLYAEIPEATKRRLLQNLCWTNLKTAYDPKGNSAELKLWQNYNCFSADDWTSDSQRGLHDELERMHQTCETGHNLPLKNLLQQYPTWILIL